MERMPDSCWGAHGIAAVRPLRRGYFELWPYGRNAEVFYKQGSGKKNLESEDLRFAFPAGQQRLKKAANGRGKSCRGQRGQWH